MLRRMAVSDFDTKVAVAVRDDLEVWQPVNVLEAGAAKLKTVRERAQRRNVPIALYTWEMFTTGHDAANRAAVRAVAGDDLDIVGIALRAPHRDADAVLRGLGRHP